MPFQVIYDERAVENFRGVPVSNQAQIARAIQERLTVDPVRLGKALVGEFSGMRRLRVGDWRVIYEVEGGNVIIRSIKLRRDAYKKR
jgi:mRNA interferase RelE/StbE